MSLTPALHELMTAFLRKHGASAEADVQIAAAQAWDLRVTCDLPQLPGFCIRHLTTGDIPALLRFGTTLGAASKDFFGPYPWADAAALPGAFQKTIDQAVGRVDASYLMELDGGRQTIGHFFLWKAGGNAHSQAHGVQVPELGVAVGDAWHGQGLGSLAVRLLTLIGRDLAADAIELTTAMTNESGWGTYQRCGYEYTGIISTPLGVDVTAAVAGDVKATRFRDERQLVCVLNEARRAKVLDYLADKRAHPPS